MPQGHSLTFLIYIYIYIYINEKEKERKEGKCCITCIGLVSGKDSLTDMKYSGVVIKKKKKKQKRDKYSGVLLQEPKEIDNIGRKSKWIRKEGETSTLTN